MILASIYIDREGEREKRVRDLVFHAHSQNVNRFRQSRSIADALSKAQVSKIMPQIIIYETIKQI